MRSFIYLIAGLVVGGGLGGLYGGDVIAMLTAPRIP